MSDTLTSDEVAALYDAHSAYVRGVVHSILFGSPCWQMAEDAVQETWYKVCRAQRPPEISRRNRRQHLP